MSPDIDNERSEVGDCPATTCSAFQLRILAAMRRLPMSHAQVTDLRHMLKSNNLAVASGLRALQRKGLVHPFGGRDQWDGVKWAISRQNTEVSHGDSRCDH